MPFAPNNIYHIYNQGNNRQTIFFDRNDYLTFLNLYKRLFTDNSSTIAWCLMPNHFHFMVATDERCDTLIKQGNLFLDPITNSIRILLSGYARIFNARYHQTGSVFRQKTKSKCISDIEIKISGKFSIQDYYSNCFHYIHQNPVAANLTDKLENWEFSSFLDYANLRKGILCDKELANRYCHYNSDDFLEKLRETIDKSISTQFV